MTTSERLTDVLKSAREITIEDNHKIVIMSDCHRGDNSWADDFADNQNLFHYALYYYYKQNFTYIELGDGDELWENKRFEDIRQTYSKIFDLEKKFYREGRFYRVLGNHDMEFKDKTVVQKKLFNYIDESTKKPETLFEGIEIPEGLILQHSKNGKRIFLVHGHQGDALSDQFWKFSRFCVRHIWKPLQTLGVHDPTSPAKNYKKRDAIDIEFTKWAKEHNQMVIAGHTHRSVFPSPSEDPLYFNTGSCVHPRGITGIEIVNGNIFLILWHIAAKESVGEEISGELYVCKKILESRENIF